ncbi:MAG: glycosyltransferase 87 family protein [Methanomassiliicoccaceae archaeon]|nr:glycosyltransferase 87 family protein [Methanomassiliicoccaceae archaeon]
MSFLSKTASSVKEKDQDPNTMSFICRTAIIVMIIGVAARLILGFFMTHLYDMYHWGLVIQNINSGNGLYELTGFFYTPPWGYILGLEAWFQDMIGITSTGEYVTAAFQLEGIAWYYKPMVTTLGFNISIKLMFMISDLVVGYLIFWIVRDITKDKRKAVLAFALWFLCPFVSGAGSVIGMFDTISVLMTLLAVVMLRKDRYMESGVMLCMATLMKFFPGFLIFIFIAYIISKNRDNDVKKKLMIFVISIVVTALVLFLPQLLDGTIADSFLFITSRLNEGVGYDNIGAVAGYIALGIYALAIATSLIFALRIKGNKDPVKLDGMLFDALLVTVAVMFLYPPLPQYVLLLLPFLIFMLMKDGRYKLPCIVLMIGTSVAVLAGGPTDLVAIAAYTDMLDIGSLMGIIDGYTGGINAMMLIGLVGSAVQYIGILLILWVRFGKKIKEFAHRRTLKETVQ